MIVSAVVAAMQSGRRSAKICRPRGVGKLLESSRSGPAAARLQPVAEANWPEVDALALLRVAAVERILREEERRVEVDVREAAETRRDRRGRAHRQPSLHHPAD